MWRLHQIGDFKGVRAELAEVLEVERQDAQQHQHRSGQRIEEELDGRVQLSRAAPDADDEVHRHQHQFPEDVEQEEIERNEHADHARLQQQEHGVVFLDAVLDRRPGTEHGHEAHQRGEHHQQQADAVDAEVVMGAERGDPVGALLELEARRRPRWKRETSGKETRNPARAARFAQIRIRRLLLDGIKSRTARPARGVNKTMLSKCWSISLPRYVIPQERQHAHHHEECVRLHAPGFEDAHRVGKHLHEETR